MKMLVRAALGLSALLACAPTFANHASASSAPAGYAPEQACVTWNGSALGSGTLVPCSAGSRQEAFALATGNVVSSPVIIYGGDYILAQTCSTYGTLALQVLGPDGATWLTAASYTTTDTGNGHGATFGSNAIVRVLLTGTAGCNASLSRVP